MDTKLVWRNVIMMVFIAALAGALFTENVRTVQVTGLFACGAVFGVSLDKLLTSYRLKRAAKQG